MVLTQQAASTEQCTPREALDRRIEPAEKVCELADFEVDATLLLDTKVGHMVRVGHALTAAIGHIEQDQYDLAGKIMVAGSEMTCTTPSTGVTSPARVYWNTTFAARALSLANVSSSPRSSESIVVEPTLWEKIKNDPDPQQRLVALKFLVHFVGDIHQPLHVGYKHDRGGNDVSVDFFGQRTNLHRVWDTMILRRDRATGKRLKAYAARVRASISAKDRDAWAAVTDPVAWANEARPYLASHVYRLPRDQRLGQDCQKAALPVVKVQLQRAGVRLATVLNEMLGEAAGGVCGAEPLDDVSAK